MATKAEMAAMSECPFSFEEFVAFCGTKKLAERLAVDMGESLAAAKRAAKRGECEDTAFEMMFWDGTLFIEAPHDLGITADELEDFGESAYCECLDATFVLGERRRRKFIGVRYEYKESEYALSAWWLSRPVSKWSTR